MNDKQGLAELLKAELAFLEHGGYRRTSRFPFRPNFIFEDSPTCMNYRAGEAGRRACDECPLISFVPEDRRKRSYPCRQIELTESRETVSSFYASGTEEELEKALAGWLRRKIAELEGSGRGARELVEGVTLRWAYVRGKAGAGLPHSMLVGVHLVV